MPLPHVNSGHSESSLAELSPVERVVNSAHKTQAHAGIKATCEQKARVKSLHWFFLC